MADKSIKVSAEEAEFWEKFRKVDPVEQKNYRLWAQDYADYREAWEEARARGDDAAVRKVNKEWGPDVKVAVEEMEAWEIKHKMAPEGVNPRQYYGAYGERMDEGWSKASAPVGLEAVPDETLPPRKLREEGQLAEEWALGTDKRPSVEGASRKLKNLSHRYSGETLLSPDYPGDSYFDRTDPQFVEELAELEGGRKRILPIGNEEFTDLVEAAVKNPEGPEMSWWKKILTGGSKGFGPFAKLIPPLGAALSAADAVAAAQAYQEAGVAGLAEHYTASPFEALPGKLGELGESVGEMGPMGGIPKVARTLADMRREASQKALEEAEVERALKNAEMWRLGESRLTEEEMAPVEGEVEDAELDLGESLLTEAEMAAPTPTEQRRAAAKKALAPQEPTVWFVPTDEEMKLFEEAWAKGEDFWGTPPAEGEDYQWGGVKMRDPETGEIQEFVRKTSEAPPSDTGSEEVVEAEVVEEDEKPRTSGRGRLPMADLHLSDLPY